MLFNSYIFIFLFFPFSLFLFFYSAKYNRKLAIGTLLFSSFVFYGWDNYSNALLLLCSIILNFIIGKVIVKTFSTRTKKSFLWAGILFNLILLSYFKYTNFLLQNINSLFNSHQALLNIALPIGISFFTFTQIAFLVDCYKGIVQHYRLLNYALFVSYFPHLIAGPIIHHQEVMPQFNKDRTFKFNYRNAALGTTLFIIGLFKKTILADYLAISVGPVFDMQANHIACMDAWIAALSYTFELYFDFSAYSDMAIGLSLFLGVKLPVNFYSPYKAVNIIEFWRRWNMTLSRFLKDYLYIPLGGNRKGKSKRYLNLMLTMLLGGLWHGASWTFVFWGFLHGFYLCSNHAWLALKKYLGVNISQSFSIRIMSTFLTFILIVIAWVFFRANDFSTAKQILNAMFSLDFIHSDTGVGLHWISSSIMLLIAAIIIWTLPNSYQLLKRYKPALFYLKESSTVQSKTRQWRPQFLWNLIMILGFILALVNIQASSIFLYFRF